MKTRLIQMLSLTLAVMLQIAPLVRSLLPVVNGLAPSTWAMVLKIGVGAVALLGFDAVSQASSISISPPNATVGQAYSGVITYSGGHSGAVASMMVSNVCIGTTTVFFDGLSVVYSGGNQATVTGTPTSANTYAFSVKVWSGNCGGFDSDTRATTLVIGSGTGGNVAPTTPFTASPPNAVAPVGTIVQLSGGTSGNPIPQYQWWQGNTPIVGATNSYLTISNAQLVSAGLYTLTASNVLNAGATFSTLPKAQCTLSVCIPPGTNFTVLNYTNFAPAGVPVTMFSFMTNNNTAVATSNLYAWYLQPGSTVISPSNTLSFGGTQLTPVKSGTYTVRFDSTNILGYIVTNQTYDSYWAFGYLPMFTNQLPATTNLNAGSNVTFNLSLQGTFNVYNPGGGNPISTNFGVPCVFWYRNSTLIASQSFTNGPTSGTTYSNSTLNVSLTMNAITSANAGNYTAVATNYWGSITSSVAALGVISSGYAPVITVQPPAALGILSGQSSTISMTATGTPSLYFQWRRSGTNLANDGVFGGALTNSLTLTAAGTNNAGTYVVVVTNTVGSVTSSPALVNVSLPPALKSSVSGLGQFQISGSTVTGLTYVVESSTNLSTGVWNPIITNNTGVGGNVSFQTNSPSSPAKFFRTTFP